MTNSPPALASVCILPLRFDKQVSDIIAIYNDNKLKSERVSLDYLIDQLF